MNDQYAELYSSYQWLVPSQFNIAQVCLHRWAENSHEGRRSAIYTENELGRVDAWSYSQLSDTCNQLANGLMRMGVQPGDRIGIAMGQRPETLAAYMALFSVGAVAVPLAGTLDAETIEQRLRHAGARVALVDTFSGPDVLQAHLNYPELGQIVGLGFQHDNIIPWRTLLARQPNTFKALPVASSHPALLVYHSHLPQKPCGTLFSHGALIGSLPGFVASQNWFPQQAGPFWSPSDWTSTEGLFAAVLPALYFGQPVVATLGRFSGFRALETFIRYNVTHTYLSSAHMRQLAHEISPDHLDPDTSLALRCVAFNGASGDNPELSQWCEQTLGITPNITLSTPEVSLFMGCSQHKWPAAAGSLGRPYPGHLVTVLNPHRLPCAADVSGELAVNRYDIHGHSDPALFLSYWNDPEASQARFAGDWYLTGIKAKTDQHGNFWYLGTAPSAIQSR